MNKIVTGVIHLFFGASTNFLFGLICVKSNIFCRYLPMLCVVNSNEFCKSSLGLIIKSYSFFITGVGIFFICFGIYEVYKKKKKAVEN